ncbi:MAG: carboxypeptidase regulatory-like domain-containing protein [Cyclobacteriaceae bacterium]
MMRIPKIFTVISILFVLSGFQLIKTSLNVTVRDELGNIVEGASVQLFDNEADYLAEKNVSSQGTTDKYGILKLKDLKAIAYYMIVRKEDKDNSGGGERTAVLEAKRINKVTIVIQ